MKNRTVSSLFVSAKCESAIPAAHWLRREFLVQSTLDGCIRRVEYHPTMRVDDRSVPVAAMIIDSDEGRRAVDFVDARPAFDPIGENLLALAFDEGCTGVICVTEEDIRREPRFSASREVWQHHAIDVHMNDRAQVVHALETEGPIPLRAFGALTDTRRDVRHVIYAMACAGDVELDLRERLNDRSIVRLGMRTSAGAGRIAYGT